MNLNFSKGVPIGRIEGGEHDNKILYLDNGDQEIKDDKKTKKILNKVKPKEKSKPKNLVIDDVFNYLDENDLRKGIKKMSLPELQMLVSALKSGKKPKNNKKISDIFDSKYDMLKNKSLTQLKLINGHFVPLPNPDVIKGSRILLGGPAGSGKSTMASNIIREYKKMFPKNDFILFSNIKEDPVLDKLKPIRVQLDESVLEDKISADELKNSISLFDDIDVIADKKIRENIQNVRDQMLMEGRHQNCYSINCVHQLCNYRGTRNLLNESDKVFFFCKSGSSYGIKFFLKTYCGLDAHQIDRIFKLPSRWVMISKTYPQYILSENECYIL